MKGGTRSRASDEIDQLRRDIESRQEAAEKRDQQTGDTYLKQTRQMGMWEKDIQMLRALCKRPEKMIMQEVRRTLR